MKRAVLYLRVSTIDQTTANQERELCQIAARMGCEITKVYKDHGISGAKGRDMGSMRFAVLPRAGNSTWLWPGRSIGLAGAYRTLSVFYPSCTPCGSTSTCISRDSTPGRRRVKRCFK